MLLLTSRGEQASIAHLQDIYKGASVILFGSSPNLLQTMPPGTEFDHVVTAAVGHAAEFHKPDLWFGAHNPKCYSTRTTSDPTIAKFIPLAFMPPGDQQPNTFFFRREPDVPFAEIFTPRQSIPWYGSSLMCALPILYHLGFRDIYLIGFSFGKVAHELYPLSTSQSETEQSMTVARYDNSHNQLKMLKDVVADYGLRIVDCTESQMLAGTYETMTKRQMYDEVRNKIKVEHIPFANRPHPSSFVSVDLPKGVKPEDVKPPSGPVMREL